MASLKALKLRIGSVKSTQKITKAMKMVAAAKLRRAQQGAEAGRPYSTRMSDVVASLATKVARTPQSPKLLAGTGKDDTHLIVVATADRGLAGAFSSNVVRAARRKAKRHPNGGEGWTGGPRRLGAERLDAAHAAAYAGPRHGQLGRCAGR
jgi:F-type H+-transporting ATPase subunit gamma